ncbi:hypothetical protein ACT02R_29500, partial [Pseudomonas aeruginosa]
PVRMSVEQVSGSAWAECPNGVESALYCEDCDIAGIAPDDSRTLAGVREHAIDPEQARRLWRLSATLTGIDAFAS